MNDVITTDKRSFEIELNSKVYSLLACKKACYALMELVSCEITTSPDKLLVKIHPTTECNKDEQEIRALLLDELLDYSLRETISEKTDSIRTLILSNAFSKTKLVDS
jgi:His-Xaa-Ser system protein HxsD